MPKTFEHSKVTVADFFKYIDISIAFSEKPSIYWLHNYEIPPELTNTVGFNLDKMFREMQVAIIFIVGKFSQWELFFPHINR